MTGHDRGVLHRDMKGKQMAAGCFAGQTVVITGAASGMGRELAIAAIGEGARALICDVDWEGLDKTVRLCHAIDRRAEVEPTIVDVLDARAMLRYADACVAAFGAPFAVFNNAGITAVVDVMSEPDEIGRAVFAVNFGGVLHGTKAFLPYLLEVGKGHIVNTSSAFGLVASPAQSTYSASKFAVRGLTETLQGELAINESGVRAHIVYPGGVRTAIARNAWYPTHGVRHWVTRGFDRILPTTRPSVAAQRILRGVCDGRARIVIGVDGRIIDLGWRVAEGTYVRFTTALLRGPAYCITRARRR
jgi:NAD(P)-dependent dehydrogenase (short-subunit alcohol dehydrogenase family)